MLYLQNCFSGNVHYQYLTQNTNGLINVQHVSNNFNHKTSILPDNSYIQSAETVLNHFLKPLNRNFLVNGYTLSLEVLIKFLSTVSTCKTAPNRQT